MDHGEGSGAARGSEKRKCHRGREDFGSTSEEEWSTGKVGVTVSRLCFSPFLFPFSHPISRSFRQLRFHNPRRVSIVRKTYRLSVNSTIGPVTWAAHVRSWIASASDFCFVDKSVYTVLTAVQIGPFHLVSEHFRVGLINWLRITVF